MRTFGIISTVISSFSGFPHDGIDNFLGTGNPNPIIEILENPEPGRICYGIDEISAGISQYIITLCSGTQPMNDEGMYNGEKCGVYEFSTNPQYAFLFPGEQSVRACISED